MHTYRKTGKDVWTVGFEAAAWRAIRDFSYEHQAAAFASYLNGGPAVDMSYFR